MPTPECHPPAQQQADAAVRSAPAVGSPLLGSDMGPAARPARAADTGHSVDTFFPHSAGNTAKLCPERIDSMMSSM